MERNPSAPSHVSKAQSVRVTGMTLNRLRYLIKTGKIITETHYKVKMIPMWALVDYLNVPNELG